MTKYILIHYIKVQNANAIAGFTWGFPAITHFLGFTHNLSLKLKYPYPDLKLGGCAVVCHEHRTHTYGNAYQAQFTQTKNPPYLKSHDKTSNPPIIEEGRMNMTVSLLIGCEGNVGNQEEDIKNWLFKHCQLQRLAGGTILSIGGVDFFDDDDRSLKKIRNKLLPGFFLMDRSNELEVHYKKLLTKNPNTELLDAWLDFSAMKKKARPKSDLIHEHLATHQSFFQDWNQHLDEPFEKTVIPESLKNHFSNLTEDKSNKKLLDQWKNYCEPNEQTEADWEYVPKPVRRGYLVPIMTGYKAISKVYNNSEIKDVRDNETDVCFVESVHSVGEWKSVHRAKSAEDFQNTLWHYSYEENWYLCKQGRMSQRVDLESFAAEVNHEEDFS